MDLAGTWCHPAHRKKRNPSIVRQNSHKPLPSRAVGTSPSLAPPPEFETECLLKNFEEYRMSVWQIGVLLYDSVNMQTRFQNALKRNAILREASIQSPSDALMKLYDRVREQITLMNESLTMWGYFEVQIGLHHSGPIQKHSNGAVTRRTSPPHPGKAVQELIALWWNELRNEKILATSQRGKSNGCMDGGETIRIDHLVDILNVAYDIFVLDGCSEERDLITSLLFTPSTCSSDTPNDSLCTVTSASTAHLQHGFQGLEVTQQTFQTCVWYWVWTWCESPRSTPTGQREMCDFLLEWRRAYSTWRIQSACPTPIPADSMIESDLSTFLENSSSYSYQDCLQTKLHPQYAHQNYIERVVCDVLAQTGVSLMKLSRETRRHFASLSDFVINALPTLPASLSQATDCNHEDNFSQKRTHSPLRKVSVVEGSLKNTVPSSMEAWTWQLSSEASLWDGIGDANVSDSGYITLRENSCSVHSAPETNSENHEGAFFHHARAWISSVFKTYEAIRSNQQATDCTKVLHQEQRTHGSEKEERCSAPSNFSLRDPVQMWWQGEVQAQALHSKYAFCLSSVHSRREKIEEPSSSGMVSGDLGNATGDTKHDSVQCAQHNKGSPLQLLVERYRWMVLEMTAEQEKKNCVTLTPVSATLQCALWDAFHRSPHTQCCVPFRKEGMSASQRPLLLYPRSFCTSSNATLLASWKYRWECTLEDPTTYGEVRWLPYPGWMQRKIQDGFQEYRATILRNGATPITPTQIQWWDGYQETTENMGSSPNHNTTRMCMEYIDFSRFSCVTQVFLYEQPRALDARFEDREGEEVKPSTKLRQVQTIRRSLRAVEVFLHGTDNSDQPIVPCLKLETSSAPGTVRWATRHCVATKEDVMNHSNEIGSCERYNPFAAVPLEISLDSRDAYRSGNTKIRLHGLNLAEPSLRDDASGAWCKKNPMPASTKPTSESTSRPCSESTITTAKDTVLSSSASQGSASRNVPSASPSVLSELSPSCHEPNIAFIVSSTRKVVSANVRPPSNDSFYGAKQGKTVALREGRHPRHVFHCATPSLEDGTASSAEMQEELGDRKSDADSIQQQEDSTEIEHRIDDKKREIDEEGRSKSPNKEHLDVIATLRYTVNAPSRGSRKFLPPLWNGLVAHNVHLGCECRAGARKSKSLNIATDLRSDSREAIEKCERQRTMVKDHPRLLNENSTRTNVSLAGLPVALCRPLPMHRLRAYVSLRRPKENTEEAKRK